MIKILQASVAYSGITPAKQIFGENLYITGSAIYENDVMSAVTHCERLGYDEKDIVIDALITGSPYMEIFDTKHANAWKIMAKGS
jgi:hypothetical protein